MKQQTAVEWLLDRFISSNEPFQFKHFEQAKQMEKEQIENAWDDAYDKGQRDRLERIVNPVGNAESYYNETFNTKEL